MELKSLEPALKASFVGVCGDFTQVSTDTRNLESGALFVALHGDRFDGHAYVLDALQKGAIAAVVQQSFDESQVDLTQYALVKVPDTLQALGEIARHWQSQYTIKKVGITGSCGKTTVKELVAHVLSIEFGVLATEKNFNNQIGVPLTLLNIRSEHQCAVLEMGASKPGDITYSGQWVLPDVAVITNAGAAHLEGMGSLSGVARTKGEILTATPKGGYAILNADDAFIDYWLGQAEHLQVITCSVHADHPNADVRLQTVAPDSTGATILSIAISDRLAAIHTGSSSSTQSVFEVVTQLEGEHNRGNILQAVTVGLVLRCAIQSIQQGVQAMKPVSGRMQRQAGWQSNITLLDDTYNANPSSVRAAIDVLAELPGQRLLVLGDMAELGEQSLEAHHDVGAFAREQGIDQLIAIGRYASATLAGFGAGAIEAASFDQAAERIKSLTQDADVQQTILLKGSRSAGVDELVDILSSQETH